MTAMGCNILFFSLFLAFTTVGAQQVNFKNYSAEHGLAETAVNAMCQDKRGFLWIGTDNGLFRFDGYSFEQYSNDDGLLSQRITSLLEANDGTLWIGTDKGISFYNGKVFTKPNFLSQENISAIVQDHNNTFWIGTRSNGLFRYRENRLDKFSSGRRDVPGQNVHELFISEQKTLWIGSNNGLAGYDGQRFRSYSVSDGLPGGMVFALAGNDHALYIGTDKGLAFFDGNIIKSVQSHEQRSQESINDVSLDDEGNLWIGTSSGLTRYVKNSFQFYDTRAGQSSNVIQCILRDRFGTMWLGTEKNGLEKIDNSPFTLYTENEAMGRRIHSLIESLNGNIICGSSLGGTTVFDGRNYSLLDKRNGFTSSIVTAFHYTPDSSLWVGTSDDGLFRFSGSVHEKYTKEEGLQSNHISAICSDGSGNLWIASADKGVMMIKPFSDSIQIRSVIDASTGLSSNKINAITTDRRGRIWIGTADKGLNIIELKGDSVPPGIEVIDESRGMNSNVIHSIISDTEGKMFVGTSLGLNVCIENNILSFNTKGFPEGDVYSLVFDKAQKLWTGTDEGVGMISFSNDFRSNTFRHFGREEGFSGSEVYRNSTCVDRNGNVWFGTVTGLVKYQPERMNNQSVPVIQLTGLKLFFDNIEQTEFGDSLISWFSLPANLELPYDQNNLTFLFTGIYTNNPQAVKYRWKLDGFDDVWSPALKDRQAIYSNLPPGKYTFQVSAGNEYDQWSTPGQFSFVITAPVWERWWARTLAVITLTGLLWSVFYFRLRTIRAKNKIVQERLEMEKNILELEQEASRLQMNPHFIFNCLNSIQGFISAGNGDEAKKYLLKFSKLMRLILENAREEFIPLEKEMSILDNYLELEQITTGAMFEYTLSKDETLDAAATEIPPMLIQPFVENAIIHGIRKKQGKGRIEIHFSLSRDLLKCTVRDNGVGRAKAAEMNGHRLNHKSTAINVTQQRLQQYGLARRSDAGIQFIDLHENGTATGTEVIILTPYEGA